MLFWPQCLNDSVRAAERGVVRSQSTRVKGSADFRGVVTCALCSHWMKAQGGVVAYAKQCCVQVPGEKRHKKIQN